jgi:hypothetical protein
MSGIEDLASELLDPRTRLRSIKDPVHDYSKWLYALDTGDPQFIFVLNSLN